MPKHKQESIVKPKYLSIFDELMDNDLSPSITKSIIQEPPKKTKVEKPKKVKVKKKHDRPKKAKVEYPDLSKIKSLISMVADEEMSLKLDDFEYDHYITYSIRASCDGSMCGWILSEAMKVLPTGYSLTLKHPVDQPQCVATRCTSKFILFRKSA